MTKTRLLSLLFAVVSVCSGVARAESVADFAFIQGIWTSQTEFQTDAGGWSPAVKAEATGQTILGGAMYQLDAVIPFPGASFFMRMTFTYDRFNKVYRVVVLDDINGYADVYYGRRSEDGSIIVDNLKSGTSFPDGEGGLVYGRLTFSPNDGGILFNADIATGEKDDWRPYLRMTFSPRK